MWSQHWDGPSQCSEWSSFTDWCWKQCPSCSAGLKCNLWCSFPLPPPWTVAWWDLFAGYVKWLTLYLSCRFQQVLLKHSIDHQYHPFTDDSELYSCWLVRWESALQAVCNLEYCFSEISRWMGADKLLNEQRTEMRLFVDCCVGGKAFQLTCLQSVMRTFSFEVHWSYWGYSLSLICLWRSKIFPP